MSDKIQELIEARKKLESKIEFLNTKQQCIKIFINATYGLTK